MNEDDILTRLNLLLLKAEIIIDLLNVKVLHNQTLIAEKQENTLQAVHELKTTDKP